MMKKILSLMLALVLVIGCLPRAFAVETGSAETAPAAASGDPIGLGNTNVSSDEDAQSGFAPAGDRSDETSADEESRQELEKLEPNAQRFSETDADTRPSASDVVTFIVEAETDSMLAAGFSAEEISDGTLGVRAYRIRQENALSALKLELLSSLGAEPSFELGFTYTVGMTGLSVKTAYGNKDAIAAMKGVKNVYVAPTYSLPEDLRNDTGDVAQPYTSNATTMIGANTLNDSGYTGKGMKIAILDTGILVDHPSFQPLSEDKLTEDSMTREDVNDVWNELKASKTTLLNRSYKNTKIPYAFNYVTLDFDVSNTYAGSDHGTHVAGISAANRTDSTSVVGVAPDAQLVVMQVFNKGGGASWDIIMAALEDCIVLGVDSINLSLGSAAGFVDPEGDMLEVMERYKNTDIQVLIAAGNDTNSAYGNLTGLNKSLSSNPDNGLLGTPASYSTALSVASVNNDATELLYFTSNGRSIGFKDTATASATQFFANFGGETLEYVVVPGYGTTDDYSGLDVTGKVALVSRGSISFPDKQANAQAAGAIACVVYNTSSGVISMQINNGPEHIPCVSVSDTDGAFLKEQTDKTFTVCQGDLMTFKNARAMSDFTSWGVTPDLKLKPEVSGVGGNIYSSTDPAISGSYYDTMSGTSMATPQVTGAAAVLMEYLRANYPELSGNALRQVTADLLMSTADPVMYNAEMECSPRQQGAGLINLVKATTSGAYLSNSDASEGRPKGEFGDDPEKTGVYTFSFQIHNMDKENAKTYSLDASVLTEALYAQYFLDATPYALSADVQFSGPVAGNVLKYDFNDDGEITTADARMLLRDITGAEKLDASNQHADYRDVNADGTVDMADVSVLLAYCAGLDTDVDVTATFGGTVSGDTDTVTVPAGKTVNVDVTLTLSDSDKTYMEQFENGIYVEGFVYVNSEDADGVNLEMPFVGFYGDWSDAPVLDSADPDEASSYPIYVFTNYSQIGSNPYFRDGKAGDAYNAFSYTNPLAEIDFGMLRNAKKLQFTVVDAKTGETYFDLTGEDITKTYYNSTYGQMIPMYVLADEKEVWDGMDADGNKLPDGTKVTYTIAAWLDDGDDVCDDSYSFDVTLDDQAPVLENAYELQNALRIDEDGRIFLTLNMLDNQNIAAVIFTNESGIIMGKYEVDNVPGETLSREFEITGFGTDMTIVLADYACNETEVDVSLDLGDHASDPVLKALDKDRLYGCETYDKALVEGGWFSAKKADFSDPKNETFDSTNRYYSAEYVNGYLIAQSASTGDLVLVTPSSSYWGTQTLYSQNGKSVGDAGVFVLYDMALDYSDEGHKANDPYNSSAGMDTLYAVGWQYEGDNDNDGHDDGSNTLFRIWMSRYNGQIFVDKVASISGTENGAELLTLGCTTEGQLYGIDTQGKLYKVSHSGECTLVGTTDFVSVNNYSGCNVIQSMGYDHNTDTMYWYAHSQTPNGSTYINVCITYKVDLQTGKCTEVGTYGQGGQTSLFVPTDLTSDLFTMGVKPTGLTLSPSSVTLAQGQTKRLSTDWSPWNAKPSQITWTSSNEDVATVNTTGIVKAVGEGSATIRAAAQIWNPYAGEYDETNYTYTGAWEDYEATANIEVVGSADAIYSFVVADFKNKDNDFSWITYSDKTPGKVTQISKPQVTVENPTTGEKTTGSPTWQGGAYYNGYVYTVQAELGLDDSGSAGGASVLYRSKVTPGKTPAETTIGAPERIGYTFGVEVGNLGFDYNTGRMYCVDLTNGGLGIMDLDTGSVDLLGTFSGEIGGPAIAPAMCVTAEGYIVISDMSGNLYTVDADSLSTTKIGSTGQDTWYYAAMTYDYNTGNIYWNPCMGQSLSPLYLVRIEPDEWTEGKLNANIVDIGDVSTKSGVEQTGMFTIPEQEPETKQIPVTGITITNGDSVSGVVGSTIKLSTVTEPLRPTVQAKTWTSGDEKVVTVDRFGTLTLQGVGETDVTVSISNKHPEDGGPFTDSIHVKVYEAAGKLVAFLNADYYGTQYYDMWLSFNDYDLRHATVTDNMIAIYSLRSGAYYDGYFYAYGSKGDFFRIAEDNHSDYVTLGQVNLDTSTDQVVSMAMDYTTGTMYGLTLSPYGDTGYLVTINLDNGEVTKVAKLSEKVFALAADKNGQLYGAGSADSYSEADLYTLDKATAKATFVADIPGSVAYTGATYYGTMQFNPQMTYDFTTDRLYLNATSSNQSYDHSAGMYMIQLHDDADPEIVHLGGISLYTREGSSIKEGEVHLGLLSAIPEADELPVGKVNGIVMNKTAGRVAVNETFQLVAAARPSNAANTALTYESADPAIATVTQDGVVTGVSAGTTDITVTSAEDPTVKNTFTVTVVSLSGPQSTAYTISGKRDALYSFNPELPGSTAEVVATLSGGANVNGITYGDNCLYYTVQGGAFSDLYRFDFTTKQSTRLTTLNTWNEIDGIAYDPVNNLLYAVGGFYLFQFNMAKLESGTTWYSGYTMDSDNCNLYGVFCVDGAVYTIGNALYTSSTILAKYSSADMNDRQVLLNGIDVNTVAGKSEVSYDSSRNLIYMTDAADRLYSVTFDGTITPIDTVGDGIDVNGLAIVPAKTEP